MTKAGKVLTIFLAVAALAFMSFAGAVYFGGPNWQSELYADDLRGRSISVGAEGNTAGALITARKQLLQEQKGQVTALDEQIDKFQKQIKGIQEAKTQDLAALNAREAELREEIQQQEVQLADLSDKLTKLSRRTTEVRGVARNRREDVMRLQNELEILRTDLERLKDLRTLLTDRLIKLKLNNNSLDERKRDLQRQSVGS